MPGEASPAFQFYPKDFLTSGHVISMSMIERGIYITLLSYCWLEGSLSADSGQLARLVSMPVKQFDKVWQHGTVRACFADEGGRLVNPRLEEERKKQHDYRRRQSDRAVKRWDSKARNAVALQQPHKLGTAAAMQAPQCSSSSSSSPSSSSSTPPTGANARARPLVTPPKNFANVAHFSDCGDVPLQLHSEFVRKFMNAGADEVQADHQARAFYAAVEMECVGQVIGDKPMDFWRARFAAVHGSGDKRVPQWAR